jgi:hypothetical protein
VLLVSAEARVARAIQDVRRELAEDPPAQSLYDAVETLIAETADALYLSDEDIDQY